MTVSDVRFHPTQSGRLDGFKVDGSGNLIQKMYDGVWHSYSLVSGADAGTEPKWYWNAAGTRVDVWCDAPSGQVLHWWYDGSAHSELV